MDGIDAVIGDLVCILPIFALSSWMAFALFRIATFELGLLPPYKNRKQQNVSIAIRLSRTVRWPNYTDIFGD